MNFVKTYIYEQEINEKGVKEIEKEARSNEELQQNEILKELPEFRNRDGQFFSLSEQIELRKNRRTEDAEADMDIDPLSFQKEPEITQAIKLDPENPQNVSNFARVPGLNEEDIQFFNFVAENGMYSQKELKQREQQIQNELNEALKNVAKRKNKQPEYEEEKKMINLKEMKEQANKAKRNSNKRNIQHISSGIKVIIKKKKSNVENEKKDDSHIIQERKKESKNDNQNKEFLKQEQTKEKLNTLLSGYSEESED